MSLATALLTPILGDASPWTPQRLFVLGEAGGVYDPANLTAEKVAWALANPGFTSAQFLAAFPTHGLYQDAAGTTPVTALGQPVGLVIDSKTGGLANVGPELVSGGVVGLLGTATAATYNTTTGVGACTRVDISNQSYVEWSGLNNARLYRLRVQVTGSVAMWVRSGDVSAMNPFTAAANATTQLIIAPSGGKITLTTQTGTANFTVLAFNEVPGVHAIQATSSSRPLLDGRVNLLTYSEQFDNAAWTKVDTTITANSIVAPDGTTTADLATEGTAGTARTTSAAITLPANTTNTLWCYLKRGNTDWVRLFVSYAAVGSANGAGAWFNLATGAKGTTLAAGDADQISSDIVSVGNGWYRCSLTSRSPSTANVLASVNTASADGSATRVNNGTYYPWGADLRLATDAAYPYQRVVTATDYADVGVPRAFLFDGFDDSLYTASNMDLSGTDEMTVLAGVRKLSDAAAGMLAETSADVSANNGSFYVLWPRSGSLNGVQSASKGTVASVANSGNTYAAPATRVLAVLADISGDALSNRINGVVDGTSATDQGTGNYGSYVLFIGRRNNASLPLNGKVYQLIVRGALTDAATLAQAERYVGARTGIFL